MKILIVEDEKVTASGLKMIAEEMGASGVIAGDGKEAVRLAENSQFDLVLLDFTLPDTDGVTLLRRLRGTSGVATSPVVMLTAMGDVEVKLRAFELGVVDYVTKPVDARELMARIRVAGRRPNMSLPTSQGLPGVNYDPVEKRLRKVGVTTPSVSLTLNEDRLFRALLAKPQEIVTKDQLFQSVWADRSVGARNLDTLVSYLRKKIAANGLGIEVVAGVGYRLTTSDQGRQD